MAAEEKEEQFSPSRLGWKCISHTENFQCIFAELLYLLNMAGWL